MSFESTTCFREKDGKPKKEYLSENAASAAAETIQRAEGRKMYVYKCETCKNFHLSPVPYIQTFACEECEKNLYASVEDALAMAARRGEDLYTYECPHHEGYYHLTKNKNEW